VAKANASHVPKARVSPVHRATHLRHHAAMARRAMPRALKVRAKVVVLTTVAKAKAKAVVHAMVHVLKAVVRTRTVAVKGAKSAAVVMVTSCHATSIL
jgi:hypothetical protein